MPFQNEYRDKPKRKTILTPKMAEFVDLYVLHGSSTKAAQESSYKCDGHPHRLGQRLLQHPLIREEIKKKLEARSNKFEVTAEYLVEELSQIVSRTKEDNPNAAIRAIELLGKTIAIWRDKQEISGPDGEAIRHEQTIKENAADFTSRISSLAKRNGTDNVVSLPVGGRTSST